MGAPPCHCAGVLVREGWLELESRHTLVSLGSLRNFVWHRAGCSVYGKMLPLSLGQSPAGAQPYLFLHIIGDSVVRKVGSEEESILIGHCSGPLTHCSNRGLSVSVTVCVCVCSCVCTPVVWPVLHGCADNKNKEGRLERAALRWTVLLFMSLYN